MSATPVQPNVSAGERQGLAFRCQNCGEGVEGRFCPDCGQKVQRTDRIRDIAWEWVRAVASTDGILWGTLGTLIVNPGRLTRDWWEGRRVNRMSPVRVLMTVVLFEALVAWLEHALIGRAEADIGLLLQVFTYQIAIVAMVVIPTVMPMLLPQSLQRSAYQHVTFALYASTLFGLVSCVAMLQLLFGGRAPLWLQDWTLALAPVALPLTVLALFTHAVVHMRQAYRLGWTGAVLRTGVLGACIGIASLILSMILTFSGLSELWATVPNDPAPPL